MEHGISLHHSQKPATCAHPEPHQFRPYPNLTSRLSILILFSHLRLGYPSGRFPLDFPLHFSQTRNTNSFCVPYQKYTILVLRLVITGWCPDATTHCYITILNRTTTSSSTTKKVTSVSSRWSGQESRHNKPNSRSSRKLSIFVLGLSRVRNVCLWPPIVTLFVVHWFSGHEYLYASKESTTLSFPSLRFPI
jgi:hypothetical protein